MAALIIAIFPQNSSRGNWEEQQDRTDPNSRFELARKPVWLLAFRQFGLPKWKHDFECCTFDHSDNSPCLFSSGFLPKNCSKIRWRENRRDGKKYSILRFSVLRNIKENQGDEIPSFCRNFESAPLWPLRYLSIWCNAIYSTILRGKMQGCGERRLAKKQNFSQKTKKSNWLFPFDVVI